MNKFDKLMDKMNEIALSIVETDSLDPFNNLAIEEYMTFHVKENEVILFLWQNQNTVVIGRNQNAWSECNINAMEEDKIHLARRMSGGGAVFHDTGNLNFTFIARDNLYDTERQTEIILNACRDLGLDAEKTGRNDLVIDGRKFSGHAYYSSKGFNYHHGTILVDVSSDKMMKYLNVSDRKLKSNGVRSVVSRVINIKDLLPGMSVDDIIKSFKSSLKKEFMKEYQKDADRTVVKVIPVPEADEELNRKYASEEWRFGKKFDYEKRIVHRFSFGEADIQFSLKDEKIKECYIYSDSLNVELSDILKSLLTGCRYDRRSLLELCNGDGCDYSCDKDCDRNFDKGNDESYNRICKIQVDEILVYLAENLS